MTYSGPGINPYWLTIQGDGSHANAGAQSELIAVTPGKAILFTATASYQANVSAAATLTLSFYNSSNLVTPIGTTLTSAAGTPFPSTMTAGTLYTASTQGGTVPSATVLGNTVVAIATIAQGGIVAPTNNLQVFQAEVDQSGIPVNANYAFTYTYYPWAAIGTGAQIGWAWNPLIANDFDSLVIDNFIETMGGAPGVQTALPQLLDSNGVGPTYRILAPPSMNSTAYGYEGSYDLNAPQPTQDVVASMLLDGERPFGARASNRTLTLPVIIFGTIAGGMKQVYAAMEYLMQTIDQQVFPIKWTPADTGLPMIFDAFRAMPSQPLYGFNYSAGGSATGSAVGRPNAPIGMITLTIQAMPYGKSDVDGIQSLPFPNPLVGASLSAAQVSLDTFGTVTGTGWNKDTQNTMAGIGSSAHYEAPRPMHSPWPAAVYTNTIAANLTGVSNLTVSFGQSYDTQWPTNTKFVSNVTLAWTLTDVNGSHLTFNTTSKGCKWGESPATPKWTLITAAIPQGRTGFAYNNVTSYSVKVSNWAGSGTVGYVRMHCWLNNLVANPIAVATPTSPRANVYQLFGLPGTARSPISIQAQLASQGPKVLEITGPSTGTWIVPPNVYQLALAESWGGGGAGSTCNLARVIGGAGGGGAGYSAEASLNVQPGTPVPYAVGAGGLPAQLVPTVIQFLSPGLNHWTCPVNVTSMKIEVWGGGAAGAAGGGGGGGAEYAQEPAFGSARFIGDLVPGTTYYMWVSHGGMADTGTTTADRNSREGEISWFGPPGTKTQVGAYVVAHGGTSGITGGTNPGYGGGTPQGNGGISTNFITAPGGNGGSSPGVAGGGGGGAAGANGTVAVRGGVGGDSPAASNAGRWQGSGAAGTGGGTGSSVGGNGGAGAPVSGYPVAGVVPGGGGGGGWSGPPVTSKIQPATESIAQASVNYLGANGAVGMVQLSYVVDGTVAAGGAPVNGQATIFGSVATVGRPVTANGGTSAGTNSAVGGLGGVASANTTSFAGGHGGFYTSGPQGSFIGAPRITNIFQTLAFGAYTAATQTSSAAASSCSQGVGVVLLESAAPVTDLYVSDSAGNVYSPQGLQSGGTAGNSGVTVYAFVANLLNPILGGTTTLTVTSATSQEYGVIWYASPWLIGGVTSPNNGSNHGNGTAVSAQFGNINGVQTASPDGNSIQYELVVAVNDASSAFTQSLYNGRLWYNAGATNTVPAANLNMEAWVGVNEGGGSMLAGSGDALSATISTANWATLSIPLLAAAQDQGVVQLDWRSGTTPGATTSWINSASIDAQGMIAVVGMCGSGASITSAPSAINDATAASASNTYTIQETVVLPANGGTLWCATAPVTHALAQGVTGTITWGHASAAPNYQVSMYWLPNTVSAGLAVAGVTGSNAAPSSVFTPASGAPDAMLLSVFGNAVSATLVSGPPVTGGANQVDQLSQAYLNQTVYAQQVVDTAPVTAAGTYAGSEPWGMIQLAVQPNVALPDSYLAQGGGAAAGPYGPGYPAIFNYGAPGYTGGGKGGPGAAVPNVSVSGSAGQGGGAAIPGGGGGGAWNSVAANPQSGGQGAAGMIRLTWLPPLMPFNTLVVHKPGDTASPYLSPVCPIPITDIPNNTEYTIPALVPGTNAEFNSTYTILLANYAWNSPQNSRQISVTVNQYEYSGGSRSSVQATKSLTPATDVVNGLVNMGEVTLPIKDYANHNDQSYFTVSINDTNTGDQFMDVMFLDTTGSTVIINVAPGTPGYGTYVNYYIDETSPDRDLGFVGATVQDRQHQVSILDFTSVNGAPLYVTPGDNQIMLWSPNGAPALGLWYAPRWYLARTI